MIFSKYFKPNFTIYKSNSNSILKICQREKKNLKAKSKRNTVKEKTKEREKATLGLLQAG